MGQQKPSTNSKLLPKDLLKRFKETQHNPSAEELPCAYKFVLLYRGPVVEAEMERGPNAGTFDTIEEATQAAVDLFHELTGDDFVDGEEKIPLYETGDWMRLVDDEIEEPIAHTAESKQINWNINQRGLLTLAALSPMGMQARVVVCDFQVDEEE